MTAQPEPPRYHYPTTHTERREWVERSTGTPKPYTPYTSDAPDAYRDGLLRGWRDHRPERNA